MKMLTGNNEYTLSDVADRLDMSERTVYRYIDTFRDAGFVIKKEENIIKIDKSSPYFKDISQLIHFTEEEAYILKSAIENIDETNLIKQNLKKKLYTVYNYKILAETVVKGKNAENVNLLIKAIDQKKQVRLIKYSSANSHMVGDRLVEPFAFTTNYIQIWAYEPSTKSNKLFKTSRIGSIEVLSNDWKFESQHKEGYIDIFRISSYEQLPIKLKMTLRAATLLLEEYPLAEKNVTKVHDNEWLLDVHVCSFEGVGRFVLGLLDEIEIIESDLFVSFLKRKLQNHFM